MQKWNGGYQDWDGEMSSWLMGTDFHFEIMLKFWRWKWWGLHNAVNVFDATALYM